MNLRLGTEKLTKSADYLQTVADYMQDFDEYDKQWNR